MRSPLTTAALVALLSGAGAVARAQAPGDAPPAAPPPPPASPATPPAGGEEIQRFEPADVSETPAPPPLPVTPLPAPARPAAPAEPGTPERGAVPQTMDEIAVSTINNRVNLNIFGDAAFEILSQEPSRPAFALGALDLLVTGLDGSCERISKAASPKMFRLTRLLMVETAISVHRLRDPRRARASPPLPARRGAPARGAA